MKIQILGTAAAEGWPALFCACNTCARARSAGGKNYRSRASLMINDIVKVDLNADSYHQMVVHGLDYSKLENILFTHSHNDHLNLGELEYLRNPFAHNRAKSSIGVWCSSYVADLIRQVYPDTDRLGIEIHEVELFKSYDVGNLLVTPVKAIHRHEETCLNWLLGPLDNAVLYASDTGFYDDETWNFLSGVDLAMVISECTGGFTVEMDTHMSINSVRHMKGRLAKSGSLKPGSRFVITHFSHNIGMLHEELEERTRDDEFIVAYDGIILEGGQ